MKNAVLCDFSHIWARQCSIIVYVSKIKHKLFNQQRNFQSHHTDHNNFPTAGSNKIKMQCDKINVQKWLLSPQVQLSLICILEALASWDSQAILVERLKMMYRILIRIPLKRALAKMRLGLVKKRSKIHRGKRVGELENSSRGTPKSSDRQRFSVFFYFFSPAISRLSRLQSECVCAPPQKKWEVEALIYIF